MPPLIPSPISSTSNISPDAEIHPAGDLISHHAGLEAALAIFPDLVGELDGLQEYYTLYSDESLATIVSESTDPSTGPCALYTQIDPTSNPSAFIFMTTAEAAFERSKLCVWAYGDITQALHCDYGGYQTTSVDPNDNILYIGNVAAGVVPVSLTALDPLLLN